MKEIKLKGLKILLDDYSIEIKDAYQINNVEKMREIIIECLERNDNFETQRTIQSFIKQWIGNNKLYKYKLFRSKTRNCILKAEQLKIHKLFYYIIGGKC